MQQALSCDRVAITSQKREPLVATRSQVANDVALKRRSLLDELSGKGVRLTAQRRALVATIQEADCHLDADALLSRARQLHPDVDRATVYRTIELLKKHRLIDELDLMHLNGEKHYYEVKTCHDHMHLACFSCGCIQEVATPLLERLKNEIAELAKFEIRVTRLEIGGRCSHCNSAKREENSK